MLTDEELAEITREALIRAHDNHKSLGQNGIAERSEKNSLGEPSLVGDWEAEEIVIKTFEESRVPITFVTEEHGIVELGRDFLAPLDGIDGTNRYRAFMNGDKNARYGTMLAIFRGINPRYNDYIIGGLMEHPTRRLLVASQGKGVFLVDLSTGKLTPVNVSLSSELDPKRVRADTYSAAKHIDYIRRVFIKSLPELNLESDEISLRSSEAHYADFALGEADWVFECTRKHNLEIAVAYGFVRERGGVMVTLDGRDIGPQKYFEFHFNPDDYVAVITAPSIAVAKKVIERLKV